MKKILGLISLFCALNLFAEVAQLNLAAVINGTANYNLCYMYTAPGDWEKIRKIDCANRGNFFGTLPMNGASIHSVMPEFIGSGKWELATNFPNKDSGLIFIFTRK